MSELYSQEKLLLFAAAIARAYSIEGYNDWYLPSLGELGLLFGARKYFTLAVSGYYSSTEYAAAQATSIVIQNAQMYYVNNVSKCTTQRVRAVRSF